MGSAVVEVGVSVLEETTSVDKRLEEVGVVSGLDEVGGSAAELPGPWLVVLEAMVNCLATFSLEKCLLGVAMLAAVLTGCSEKQ